MRNGKITGSQNKRSQNHRTEKEMENENLSTGQLQYIFLNAKCQSLESSFKLQFLHVQKVTARITNCCIVDDYNILTRIQIDRLTNHHATMITKCYRKMYSK